MRTMDRSFVSLTVTVERMNPEGKRAQRRPTITGVAERADVRTKTARRVRGAIRDESGRVPEHPSARAAARSKTRCRTSHLGLVRLVVGGITSGNGGSGRLWRSETSGWLAGAMMAPVAQVRAAALAT